MTEHSQWHLLSAFIDGELSAAEKADVEAHLSGCSSCRMEADSLKETKRWLGAAPRRALPVEALAQLEVPEIGDSYRSRVWRSITAVKVWVPVGAAAFASLAFVAWFLTRPGPDDYIPLESLLAAHSHYSSTGLVAQRHLLASDFSSELASFHEDAN